MNYPATKEESENYILGRIYGLNEARLAVWGIGYDKDDTARMIRAFTSDEIMRLKEILEIKYFGDSMFESAHQIFKSLKEREK